MCNWLAEEAQTSYEEYGNDCKLATAVMVALGVRLITADEWPVLRMLFGHDELLQLCRNGINIKLVCNYVMSTNRHG